MEPYITRAQFLGIIPDAYIVEALDDDGDGVEDEGLFDIVAQDVADKIHGLLGGRFTVPFTGTVPPVVTSAAKWFFIAQVYGRRGVPEQNPYKKEAEASLELLTAIGKGEAPLSPAVQRARPPVSVITRPAKTVLSNGGFLA
ncbi:MAG: DUF1320 family protein [Victivallaceae bacterium]|nr:DUF1320 family protein [Victivallaceae bacterium]